jgi:hypothetical protein
MANKRPLANYSGSIQEIQSGDSVSVACGGTGAVTLTGYLYGNGTGAFTGSTSIPTTALSGTISNDQLANSSITIGSTAVSLGATASSVTALGLAHPTVSDYATFTAQSSNPSASTGLIWYDQSKDSLSYYNSTGYEINIGQQVDQVCYNNTGSTIPAGTAVYLSGGSSGAYPYITPAIATSQSLANMVGITGQSIATGATGVVVILGEVFNYNTTGMTAGQTLYLSPTTAGALTTTQPASPFYAVRAGFVVVGGSSTGTIFTSVRNVYTLGSNIITPVSLTAFSTSSNVLQLYGYSSSQIADLIDIWTYSGGTKAFAINSAGAIYAGTWNGSTIGVGYGGTGITTTPANGALLVGNGTNYTSATLTAGTGVSVTNGSGSITIASSGAESLVTKTSAYTATATDYTILANATSAAFSVTLPTAVGANGKLYIVKKVDSSANAVTVATTSAQTIDGASTYVMGYQYQSVTVQSDGANWFIVGEHLITTWQAI